MKDSKLEAEVQAEIRDHLSKVPGLRIFRNNVAKIKSPSGRWVDYGLGVGSSDLIGFKSITITPDMVGSRVAVFLAVECKRGKGGRLSPEQVTFLDVLKTHGAIALVARSVEDVKPLMTSE